MKSFRLMFFPLMTTLLVGCLARPAPAIRMEDPTSQPTTITLQSGILSSPIPDTAVNTPVPTISATKTPISPTVEGTPEVLNRVEEKCYPVISELPKDKIYPGKLILDKHVNTLNEDKYNFYEDINHSDEVSFYDLNAHQRIPIPEVYSYDVRVSMDGKKYALRDENDSQVKVYSSDGKPLSTISIDKEYRLVQWLGNEKLLFMVAKIDGNAVQTANPADFLVVDPITKTQKTLRSDYPDVEKVLHLYWEGGGLTKYNRNLTEVVYLSYSNGEYRYVLFDLTAQRKITEIVPGYEVVTPKWSPDGSKLALFDQDREISIVDRNGKITQLTHFYNNAKNNRKDYTFFLDAFSWSPDSRYLALWVVVFEKGGSYNGTLEILDTTTGEIRDLCIPLGYFDPNRTTLPFFSSPVWSQDGKYLTVRANNREDGNFDLLLVDLDGRYSAKIADNLVPVGWTDQNK